MGLTFSACFFSTFSSLVFLFFLPLRMHLCTWHISLIFFPYDEGKLKPPEIIGLTLPDKLFAVFACIINTG